MFERNTKKIIFLERVSGHHSSLPPNKSRLVGDEAYMNTSGARLAKLDTKYRVGKSALYKTYSVYEAMFGI
jgi:peptidyl-tRNA hydrolase